MRPTSILAPYTYTIAASMVAMVAAESLTVTGEHSATPKGWKPGVRPASRRNGIAALACALRLSDAPEAAPFLASILAGDKRNSLALALSLDGAWNDIPGLTEGWCKVGEWTHDGIASMVSAALAGLTLRAQVDAEVAALASLDAMEAERISNGKAKPFPAVGDDMSGDRPTARQCCEVTGWRKVLNLAPAPVTAEVAEDAKAIAKASRKGRKARKS